MGTTYLTAAYVATTVSDLAEQICFTAAAESAFIIMRTFYLLVVRFGIQKEGFRMHAVGAQHMILLVTCHAVEKLVEDVEHSMYVHTGEWTGVLLQTSHSMHTYRYTLHLQGKHFRTSHSN